MLYGSTLLRAFSAFLLVSVLTACGGGGGSGGDDTAQPPVTQPDDNGGGDDTGGDDSGGGDTGGGDTGGGDTGGGDTGGGDTGGGDTGGGDTGGGDTGGGDTGGGDTGGGGEDPPPVIEDVTGVWHVEIAPAIVTAIENLNNQPGIVDQWLPGRKIIVVDHDDVLEISTCIDNPNLPATRVVWDVTQRAYIPENEWTFGNLPIKATIERTDNQLTLAVEIGATNPIKLGFAGSKLTTLNNSFALSSEAFDQVYSTSLVCGAFTTGDAGSALQVTAYVADNFLNLSFPSAASVGSYVYEAGEIQLLSEPLAMLLDTTLQAATLDVTVPELQRVQVGFDLTTVENAQLHGDVILNQFTLP
jgi:hypothetical protein